MKTIIVTGGRGFLGIDLVFQTLTKINPDVVITGACPTGVDQYAERWAKANERTYLGVPAQWTKYGKSAGPRRNQDIIAFANMFEDTATHLECIAFPGGNGTANMVGLARQAGFKVTEIQEKLTNGN